MGMTAILGGAFDPPHNGHVELARAARERFAPERLVVLVAARPGHKEVVLDPATRLRLARAAFPGLEVELDGHARTVDLLDDGQFDQPLFLIGADEFADFLTWKEPNRVLELARLGVATRPGYPRERLDGVLAQLDAPERVSFFETDPLPIASRELRALATRGEALDPFVPPDVARIVRDENLYTVREPRGSEPT